MPFITIGCAMRILTERTLREFWERRPDAERPLREWLKDAKAAKWTTPAEVRSQFATASIIRGNRVVFNIKGNDYRLVARIDYAFGMVFVRFIGTHAEYDRIDAAEV